MLHETVCASPETIEARPLMDAKMDLILHPSELASHTGPSSALSVHACTKARMLFPATTLVRPRSSTLGTSHFVTPLPTLFVVSPAPKWQEVAQPHAWLLWTASPPSPPSPARLPHRSTPRQRTPRRRTPPRCTLLLQTPPQLTTLQRRSAPHAEGQRRFFTSSTCL
jgi:hypothetical protein